MAGFSRRFGRIAVVLSMVVAIAGASGTAATSKRTAHVLVVYSSSRAVNAFEDFHSALIASVRGQSDIQVEIHSEFLDELAGRSEAYESALSEYLKQKYADLKIEVVAGVSGPGARTAAIVRQKVFPEAQLVFGAVDPRVIAEWKVVPEGTVGVTALVDLRRTIEIALACHPGTKRVAFVLGSTQMEIAWRQRLLDEIAATDASLEAIDLAGLDADTLMRRLAGLPDHTIVLWAAYFRDGAGVAYTPHEILDRARSESSAPIYGVFDFMLGTGIVGGSLASFSHSAELTGQLILQQLRGESPYPGGVPLVSEPEMAFDARELERWGIPESRLPAGAAVRFRESTVWDLYGWYITGALVLFSAQALLIGGLLVQRKRRISAQRIVTEQLAFERLVSGLSSRLSEAPLDSVDDVLAAAIDSARPLFGADRMTLVEFEGESAVSRVRHSSVSAEASPLSGNIDFGEFPELIGRLQRGEVVRIDDLAEIEADMPLTHDAIERAGVSSSVVVPLQIGGSVIGLLGMARLDRSSGWTDVVVSRMQILADVFANALGRRTAAERVRKSEELSHAVLGSLSAQVCVIDNAGQVVAGNDAWQRAAPVSGVDVACTLLRRHCRDKCDSATSCDNADSIHARAGIRSVVEGEQPSFSMEYRLSQPTGDTWHVVTVERLRLPEGGAVVSNLNITARKRAELDAEQRRQELMHFSRVSAMGELAASLAHELNQPLTGVLTNAQAAVRFIDENPPNVTEVREILGDIIEDDRRAGEVIRRLRAMLQSGSVEAADVDINEVVTNVVRLVASDSILRDVTIVTELAPDLARIAGDRIQMQQVVLNLIVNAMDAMRSQVVRRVVIRTAADDHESVLLTVSDTGPGIEHDRLGKVFQPFYTTKSDGLGMGLSIARTIVEAHGGVLWAANNPDGGASFLFRLPASKAMAVTA